MESPHPLGLDKCGNCGHSETWHSPRDSHCEVLVHVEKGLFKKRDERELCHCKGWIYGEPVKVLGSPVEGRHPVSRAEGRE